MLKHFMFKMVQKAERYPLVIFQQTLENHFHCDILLMEETGLPFCKKKKVGYDKKEFLKLVFIV